MKKLFTYTICWLMGLTYSYGQVKSNYEYNTSMPYGTLDLRTRISSSNYYYLEEDKTFSFRESSPGVKTNTYLDMTNWDSSPYSEGHLRHKIGTADAFVMNYRLLFPQGYKSTYAEGYPMIVHFHGAYERANCLYDNCYHADWNYTVEENSPPAPTSPTHKLLNNDDNLNVGGEHYLGARNLAGTRLPNDPAMPDRAFPGFVVVPQMMNIWDSLQVEDVARIVRLLSTKYNIDEDRIYVQGLSIGGYAVYESMKRASWLYAAALPMSSVWDANIFTQNQEDRVAHMPIWIFQGGEDPRPTPAYTEAIVSKLRKAGAVVRYSLYSDLGHTVWHRAYRQTDYFPWMLEQSKANLHASSDNTVIDRSKNIFPKLALAEGFLAYQWEKDGVIIGHSSNSLTVTAPGKYRARFSRKSASPTDAQWNEWSLTVTITETGDPAPTVSVAITNPDDNAAFTAPASISMTATASVSDGSIAKVEFYNGATKLGEDATSPYAFTWSNVASGNYSLIAKAIDGAGNSATDMVDITVNDAPVNDRPTVNITSPDNGQLFTAPASIDFSATASDSDGSVAKVEFYNGEIKLGQDATSPYSFTWTNVSAGAYSLIAKAIDNDGSSRTDMVSITVNDESGGSSCASTGSIQVETWTGISGKEISSIPVNSSPSSVDNLTVFETPAGIGDNYGSRVRGYICVPTTGNYTFWIASDDTGELWLSTDENPANKSRIAHVSGWTRSREWDKSTSQKSSPVSLVAGRRYYIEALLKEATGGDHLAVGWQLPGGTLERPIPGDRLIPFQNSANSSPAVNITSPNNGQSFTAPASINITATASDSDGAVDIVEFYNGEIKLGQDASSPYSFTWSNVSEGAYSIIAKAIDNDGSSKTDMVAITVESTSGGSACASTGSIQVETWTGISGKDISSIPVNSPPSSVDNLTLFETPASIGDNYGSRVRGYICVPATGDYTFWIASDDTGELWLSTDENPANKSRIAYVSGWTRRQEWDKFSSQRSDPVRLESGRQYYIEALLKEASGGDHLAVGWQLPGGAMERPIPGDRLISFGNSPSNNPPTVRITSPDGGGSFTAPATINITATASDGDGSVSLVEFFNGGTKLGQDASSPYSFTWSNVSAGDYSLIAKATDNSGNSTTDKVAITVDGGSGSACASTGSIMVETWTGISGKGISSIPVNSSPSSVADLTNFATEAGIGDNYGSRVRGYICVPTTGNYTFWIASDDSGELWLSTDEDPVNKSRIAYVSGWTYPLQWDKFTTQRSAPVSLVGGRRYYIEALLKEAAGGDHLEVGWQLPSGAMERPIPGSRLSKFENTLQSMALQQMETTEDATLYSEISVYPNPTESADAQLTVGGYEGLTEAVQTQVEIVNMTGEVVFKERIYCGGNCSDYRIEISQQLAPGVYLVSLTTNGVKHSRRLFVK